MSFDAPPPRPRFLLLRSLNHWPCLDAARITRTCTEEHVEEVAHREERSRLGQGGEEEEEVNRRGRTKEEIRKGQRSRVRRVHRVSPSQRLYPEGPELTCCQTPGLRKEERRPTSKSSSSLATGVPIPLMEISRVSLMVALYTLDCGAPADPRLSSPLQARGLTPRPDSRTPSSFSTLKRIPSLPRAKPAFA